jgi:hypothetical protein
MSLGERMNRILGYIVSFPSAKVELGTNHFPSHFSHIRPIAIYQLAFNYDIAGNIPIPGCRRHISKSTLSARILFAGLPADLYDVWTISSAHVFPSKTRIAYHCEYCSNLLSK